MARFNVYKIPFSKKDELIRKFTSVGLKKTERKKTKNFALTFYFVPKPKGDPIWWVNFFSSYLGSYDLKRLTNKNHCGVFLLEYRRKLFAISFGKSHFYLQEFAEIDFGVDIGTRIINKNAVDIKNSKLFGGVKKKSITTYRSKTAIDIDGGESIAFLKGESIDAKEWGKKISCGTSVQLSLPLTKPINLTGLIKRIVKALKQPPKFEIPRAIEVKSKTIKEELDDKLAQAIDEEATMFNMNEQSVSGVEFIFQKDYELWSGKVKVDTELR